MNWKWPWKREEKKKPLTVKERARSWGSAILVFYFVQTFLLQAFSIPSSSMEKTLMVGDFLFVNKFIYGARSPENIPFTEIMLPRFQLPAFRDPQQGDVVIFRFPHPELRKDQKGLDYIKRCVAAAGQTVEVRNKELFVDGVRFAEKFDLPGVQFEPGLDNEGEVFPPRAGSMDNFGPVRIPKAGDTLSIRENLEWVRYLAAKDGKKLDARGSQYTVDGEATPVYVVGQDYYFMMGDNRDNSLDSRAWGPVPRNHVIGQGMFIYWSNVEAAKQTNWVLKILSTLNLTKVQWSRVGRIIR